MITIQTQNCLGKWSDMPDEHTEAHLVRLAEENGLDEVGAVVPRFRAVRPLTRDEVIATLLSGRTLRNAPDDWYSVSRIKPAPRPEVPAPTLVLCDCGHRVPTALAMRASRGTTCPECYDEWAN